MYIIPGILSFAGAQDPELNFIMGIAIVYVAVLTALAFVPVYKMNKAAISGKKLPIQHFSAANWGLIKGVGFVFTLMLAISNAFNNNNR